VVGHYQGEVQQQQVAIQEKEAQLADMTHQLAEQAAACASLQQDAEAKANTISELNITVVQYQGEVQRQQGVIEEKDACLSGLSSQVEQQAAVVEVLQFEGEDEGKDEGKGEGSKASSLPPNWCQLQLQLLKFTPPGVKPPQQAVHTHWALGAHC